MRKLVIIPTYNEIANISPMIDKVMSLSGAFDLLIIDDGSPDGTADVVRRRQQEFGERLFMIERRGKLGLGTAYLTGFRWALQARRDTLLARAATLRVQESEVAGPDLAAYFERHRARYHWDAPRYRGIVLRCADRRVGKRVRKMLKQLPPADWTDAIRLLFNSDGVQVLAEQGTFAPGQNPWVDERVFRRGKAPGTDGYPNVVLVGRKLKGPDDYREILDVLSADYRADRESHWLMGLRAAGMVEINQEVLKTVNKQ